MELRPIKHFDQQNYGRITEHCRLPEFWLWSLLKIPAYCTASIKLDEPSADFVCFEQASTVLHHPPPWETPNLLVGNR